MKIPCIMDCDPGHDDAIALVLAYGSDKIDIQAITTTAGNQTIEKTTNNALRIMTFLGAEIPVAAGCAKPLFRDLIIAPEVHGESGLDGPELPDPAYDAQPVHAVELMAETVRKSKEKITIVPTGALTNVALFLMTYPELKGRIERISLMGGACWGGNWTPAAEFNILVDPEAARIVFESGIPITMSGLDVTHKAYITDDDRELFRSIGTRTSILVAEWLDFFAKFHKDNFDFKGSPLHDPCAVVWLINPDLFTARDCHVDIETSGKVTTGSTVVDYYDVLKKEKNATVLFDVRRKDFVDLLAGQLEKMP
ncbi:pyrimidine-specific ribonucleoside hydrolase RihA [Spirochaeta isovalerica]|uniref:Pyrimidine-specific ribonucleoside hydrolase n=1 Tax=Spirochaeta isovalerica TaxID=150 RepID=A0A841R4Z9_9SPIO|nr:pyrimidine-specific ribonucleoside hydrolase RihA [Spirochaeta isovalerica]MBB6478873.1 pyrimidine-specific ribonucleoside hydrolase [Spirochaeta isovalerica]